MFERCVAWGGSLKKSGYSSDVFQAMEDGILTSDNAGIVTYKKGDVWYGIENCSKFEQLLHMQRISYAYKRYEYLVMLMYCICIPWLLFLVHNMSHLSYSIGIIVYSIIAIVTLLFMLMSDMEVLEYMLIRKKHAVAL